MPNGPSILERIRGKRTSDIQLPQEGPRDPRLPPATKAQQIQAGYDIFKRLGTRNGKRNGKRSNGRRR